MFSIAETLCRCENPMTSSRLHRAFQESWNVDEMMEENQLFPLLTQTWKNHYYSTVVSKSRWHDGTI